MNLLKINSSIPDDVRPLYFKLKLKYEEIENSGFENSITFKQFLKRWEIANQIGKDQFQFLKEEFRFLNSWLAKYKVLTEKKESSLEKIANDIYKKFSKYPRKIISSNASLEIEHLLGAILGLEDKTRKILDQFRKKIPSNHVKKLILNLEYRLNLLTDTHKGLLPKPFFNYKQKIFSMRNEDDIQKAGYPILQEVFNFLMDLLKLLNWIYSNIKDSEKFNLFIDQKEVSFTIVRKELNTMVDDILSDFRLKDLI